MKKFMISLAIASISMFSYAQQETVNEVVVPTVKNSVATNSFGSNWFVGVNGGVNLYNGTVTNGESPFEHLSPALNVYVGKWHTPGFGWRVGYNGLNIQCFKEEEHTTFMNFHFDAMFNLSNLFCGYREDRIWNVIPYVGVGWAGRKGYSWEDEARMGDKDITGTLSANYGIMNTFRVAKRWAINLELSGYFFRNGFSGVSASSGHDMMWAATVGVTYRIGKVGWDATVDVPALQAIYGGMIDGLDSQLDDALAENKALKDNIARMGKELDDAKARLKKCNEKECVNVEESVFFAFDSYKIASKKEELNIKAYADAAKAANKKLVVKGYADKTGASKYNLDLSQKRADAVKAILEQNGAEVQSATGYGITEDLKERALNRRVIIKLAD